MWCVQSIGAIQITDNSFIDSLRDNKTNTKICLVCGQRYDSDDNFCSNHKANLVSISEIQNLTSGAKICPVCGDVYENDDNFCSNHDKPTDLVAVKDLDIYRKVKIISFKSCPNDTFTIKYPNSIETVEDLFTDKNIDKLKNLEISQSEYEDIIDFIIRTYQANMTELISDNSVDFNSLTTLEKMILFSKSFVKTCYKSGGGDLGYFAFNEIFIDDRLDSIKQITTIVHELTHFLLAEILEQIVCYTFSSTKSDLIEAFVCYRLQDDFNNVIDEYCAHTIEGKYARFGYQDYGSYHRITRKILNEYNEEYLDIAKTIGNTFSKEISKIMSSFIDDDLRNDILDEFKDIKEDPNYDEVNIETNKMHSWDGFRQSISVILTRNIESTNFETIRTYTSSFRQNR